MRFINNERTRVAYQIGRRGDTFKIVAEPGENVVSDEHGDALMDDDNFRRHAEDGFIVILDDDGEPMPAPEPRAPRDPARPRAVMARHGRVIHPRVEGPHDESEGERAAHEPPPVVVTAGAIKAAAPVNTIPVTTPSVETADDTAFLAAWDAMDDATKVATSAALDDRLKAVVQAHDAAKAGA